MTASRRPPTPRPLNLLIINPNTTTAMTTALKPLVSSLLTSHTNTSADYFTAPSTSEGGVPSINSPADAERSAHHCFPHVLKLLDAYDGFLVACYSEHPLVRMIGGELETRKRKNDNKETTGRKQYVTGIFEASVGVSLGLLAQEPRGDEKEEGVAQFGIVSTGKVWEEALREAVEKYMGVKASARFAGVQTTGLNAKELHELPGEEVRRKMAQATGRLVKKQDGEKGKVKVVCLGCAGMVGLDDAVRTGCVDVLGETEGNEVRIVDGVAAGVEWLVCACRTAF